MVEWRYSPTVLNLGTMWRKVVSFTPWLPLSPEKGYEVLIRQEAVWAPQPVWMLLRRDKFLPLPGIESRILGRQTRNLATILRYPRSRLCTMNKEKCKSVLTTFFLLLKVNCWYENFTSVRICAERPKPYFAVEWLALLISMRQFTKITKIIKECNKVMRLEPMA